ncbi:MAG TPA: hypothetical protein VGG48_14910 [Rhizomicrobium sp.]|jgi:fibronectin-binding autotransporter adhesin
MATILWNENSGTFDWTDPTQWEGGAVPGSGDTAKLSGTQHVSIAKIDTAIAVHEIIMNAVHSTIDEISTGSITATELDYISGTLILNAVNTFTTVDIGSYVEIGADGALGKRAVFEQGGMIEADANVNFRNALNIQNDAQLSAKAGFTETTWGAISADTLPEATDVSAQIFFGSTNALYGDANATGTVELGGTSFALNSEDGLIIEIMGGTVKSGSGQHALGADEMFNDATQVTLDSHTLLDVGHFGTAVTLSNLTGQGTLEDSGDAVTITLTAADFTGTISGNSKLATSGANVLAGGIGNASIAMAASSSLDLVEATGHYTLTSAGLGARLTIGSGTVNHIDGFNSGNLTIDTNFAQYDLVVFKSGDGYEQAVIHPGHGAATTSIYFYGLTSSAGINVGNDGSEHLQFTYGAPAEHAAAIENAVAEASFVPMDHGLFG